MITVNETPIRTARNFNINNIKIDELEDIKNEITSFNNFKINNEISISEDVSDTKLIYGLGEKLENQVKENSNKKIKLLIDKNYSESIELEFTLNKNNPSLVENIEIEADENKKANIIIKYKTEEDLEFYHNGIIKVLAKNNSELNISVVNLLNTKTNNFLCIENAASENAKIKYCIIDLGGKKSITNYYTNLKGMQSENKVEAIYLGNENQVFDLNYIGDLEGEKTNIDIDVQGALKDTSKKNFKGTINFKKGSKKAKGNENEFCTLLSDKARSIALPMLLCSEEDVEGNHSTATGKVDDNQLFYIMSRGFEYKEAMKLIVKARFNKILENIKNEKLKNEIIYEIDSRLD